MQAVAVNGQRVRAREHTLRARLPDPKTPALRAARQLALQQHDPIHQSELGFMGQIGPGLFGHDQGYPLDGEPRSQPVEELISTLLTTHERREAAQPVQGDELGA